MMLDSIIAFWHARSPREQAILSIGGALLLAVGLIAYVWQPGELARVKFRRELPQLRVQYATMQREAQQLQVWRQHPAVHGPSTDLKTDIDASATRHGVHAQLNTLDVDDAGRAHIALNMVSWETWIRWVGALQNENHLHLDTCHVQALPVAGMVKVDAMFSTDGQG